MTDLSPAAELEDSTTENSPLPPNWKTLPLKTRHYRRARNLYP